MPSVRFFQNRKWLKLCSFTLLAILLLGTIVSCKPSNDPPVKTEDLNQGEQTTEPPADNNYDPEAAPTPYMEDFGSYNFRVLTRGSGLWTSDDITGDMTGSVLAQAVFNRNEVVSNRYHFSITETKDNNWTDTARVLGAAGQDAYDMWSFRMNDMPTFGQEGYIWNLNEIKWMNLDAAYYDQSTRKSGSFANHLFFITGDLLYLDDLATHCIYFNVDLWNNFELTEIDGQNLYQIVEDKKWTLDKMLEFSREATKDKDGNDVMDKKDYWGFCFQNADILALNVSANNDLLTKDDQDVFVLNRSMKQVDDLQKIMSFLNSGCSVGRDWKESVFTQGTQLFQLSQVMEAVNYKADGINFGMVPYPMIDSNQQEYRSFITTYGSNCITICKSVKDVNKTASIIELLSYQSRQTVTPKLNEYLFEGRVTNNAEDVDMLNIVLSNKAYELCYLWSTGSLYSTMISLNSANSQDIASSLENCESAVAASVARKLERLKNLA